MTRIAVIAGTYQPDRCGVAHYTAHLRETLASQGVTSIVLTTYDAAKATDDCTVQGVVKDWRLSSLIALTQAIHAAEVDLLHIQHAAGTYRFERAIFLLPLLLRMSGWRKPIVTTIHEYGWWEWQPKWPPANLLEWLKNWGQNQGWWDREDGFLLTQSDALITTNSDAERVIRERLPEISDRLHRISIAPNVEVAEIERSIARQKLLQVCHWSDNSVVIAFFGFLHPVKGLETLFPAFKQVLVKYPQVKLLLIGGVESLALPKEQANHYWQKLYTQVSELELEQAVHFTGYVTETAASHFLSGADLGVLPFNHGVNLKSGSLLTLLAHGLPTVATYSTPPDLDLQNSPVQLIQPRKEDELVATLINILENSDQWSQLYQASKDFVQRFDWQHIVKAHLAIYQNTLTHYSTPTEVTSEVISLSERSTIGGRSTR